LPDEGIKTFKDGHEDSIADLGERWEKEGNLFLK